MHPIVHEREPEPSEVFSGSWLTAKLRRTVDRVEWIGCWRFGFGYLELFEDGSARMKITGRGKSYDVDGPIKWNWMDPRRIRLSAPGQPLADGPPTLEMEYHVIRFDERTMWVEMKQLNGAMAGFELTRHLQRSRRPKSWQIAPGGPSGT